LTFPIKLLVNGYVKSDIVTSSLFQKKEDAVDRFVVQVVALTRMSILTLLQETGVIALL